MRRPGLTTGALLAAIAIFLTGWWLAGPRSPDAWTDGDLAMLASLSIDRLPAVPPDPSNAVADSPAAARLGHRLFFDPRLSAMGNVSCATCHQPERRFTDGLPKGRGLGLSGRNTRSIVGTAYSPWLYWDGRRDSQWAQALSPLEDPAEHGGNRMRYVRFISEERSYRDAYEAIFGALPDFSDTSRYPPDAAPSVNPALTAAWESMSAADRQQVNTVFANIGKALAAYERLLLPGRSRFDDFVTALLAGDDTGDILTNDEILGLQLYIDEARCMECHNGPLFTNHEFHNTGILSFPGDLPDRGRIDGVREVTADPFNCSGAYSDDPERRCTELRFVRRGQELLGAMRTPSLRNLGGTEPYAHKGQQETLRDVIDQYDESPLAMIGHNEAEFPLGLSHREKRWLEAFLLTLDAPLATDQRWLSPPPYD